MVGWFGYPQRQPAPLYVKGVLLRTVYLQGPYVTHQLIGLGRKRKKNHQTMNPILKQIESFITISYYCQK